MGKYKQHSAIEFGKNTVTKTALPDLMRVEVEKTRRAFEIGKECAQFRVPEVLDYDEARGVAVFERLDIKPVLKAVPWGKQRSALAKNLGVSLAIIHRELTLPDSMHVALPEELASPHDEVFLHGDVSVQNVCVGASWPPITILDWQTTPLYGGRATYGTRYFDILWFITNLIYNPYTRFLFSNPVAPVARAFMESYFHESRLPFNSDKIAKYAKRFFGVEIPRLRQEIIQSSKGRARLLLPSCRAIVTDFVNSLQTMGPNTLVSSCRGESFER